MAPVAEGDGRRVLRVLAILVVLAAPAVRPGSGTAATQAGPRGGAPPDLHEPWTRLLREYVDADGLVAYRSLARRDRGRLEAYLARLAAADPRGWPRADQEAFWIDAYNANVVAGILEGFTPETFWGRERFFRWYRFRVAGAKRTLDEIEHRILRREFRDPRIHFALVCGARSCPRLRREAYVGSRLDAQLDDQIRSFLQDPRKNRIDGREAVELSAIFEWFAPDFRAAAGSPLAFIRRYAPLPAHVSVRYLPYDWTLNAQPGERP